jgi:secondary thiamine-phosphate synthase enzyme
MLATITLETEPGDSLTDITDRVRAVVSDAGVRDGLCCLVVPHTTAAITVNSRVDQATLADIVADVRRLVPTRTDFHHVADSPADAAGHVKASLIGSSQTLVIQDGDLVLGHSQSLLLFDFDGPRQRRVMVKVIAG